MKLLRLFCLSGFLAAGLTGGEPPAGSTPGIQAPETGSPEIVKVGLLIRKQKGKDNRWLAAKRGAEIAVSKANARGGYSGRPFRLIVRSINGLWGSGSKEIVKMVFEDSVRAILSSLDGRSAHLAEQIATKGQVILVASRATDPTLTQINIPWFFRCIPDDRQQAKALVEEIYQRKKLKQVSTVAEETYDARMAADSFIEIAMSKGYQAPFRLPYKTAGIDFQNVLNKMEQTPVEGVVFFGKPALAAKFIRAMRARGMEQAFFGPVSLLAGNELLNSAGPELEKAVFVAPGYRNNPDGQNFEREFRAVYGYPPDAIAAYAYDGMSLILEAIRKGGLDKWKIRDALANIDYARGVTGSIRFDAKGNRVGPVNLVRIIEGKDVRRLNWQSRVVSDQMNIND